MRTIETGWVVILELMKPILRSKISKVKQNIE